MSIPTEKHIGREYLIYRVFVRLNTDDVQSTVIIGTEKFGKTAFINHLQQPSVIKQYLGDKSDRYIFLAINPKEKNLKDEADFFNELYQQAECLLSDVSPLKIAGTDLQLITDWLKTHDKRLILILDDFHSIIVNQNYQAGFYNSLRAWFSNDKYVSCIITSPLELEQLPMPDALKGSPFFNIFAIYHLGSLTASEAVKLIESKVPEQFRFPEEILEIVKQVGFNPYELQIAGSALANYFKKHKKIQRNELYSIIQTELKNYYQTIYNNLNEHQRNTFKTLLKSSDKEKLRIDNELIDRGWISKNAHTIIASQMENFFKEKFSKKQLLISHWKKSIKK